MESLTQLQKGRFVVLGRAGMDLYAEPPDTGIVEAERFMACLGGSSANIAVAISRQGGKASLVTTVSDDPIGQFCLRELDRYGVNRDHVRAISGSRRNSLAIAENRLVDHQCVLYRNNPTDFQMTVNDVESVDYDAYDGLIVTGTVFAEDPSRTAAFRALELARMAGLVLIFDLDYRPHSWVSAEFAAETLTRAGELCTIVIGNDVEFDFMAGEPGKGLDKARVLAGSTTDVAVYKMGEHGAITIFGQSEIRTGVFNVDTLKPIGAGDGFMGGFVAGLIKGCTVEDAVIRGSASAAIVVTNPGCAPAMPNDAEIEEFMQSHPRPVTTERSN